MAKLRGIELKMQRKILSYKLKGASRASQDNGDYMAIAAGLLHRFRRQHQWPRWDEEALLQVHKWAGHVARLSRRAPERLVGQALLYRGSEYLAHLSSILGNQGHTSRFHVWRWEDLLAKRLGNDWKQLAVTGELWEDTRNMWLSRLKDAFKTKIGD